jgi:hypothetical protein
MLGIGVLRGKLIISSSAKFMNHDNSATSVNFLYSKICMFLCITNNRELQPWCLEVQT